jgi:ferric-dicitrate binding protein FerR (iron transport regulator)
MSDEILSCGPLDSNPGDRSESSSDSPTDRFDFLVARFFDNLLSETEDREFVDMLEADAARARRFLELARLDRAIAGLSSSQRVNDEAFEQAVRKSLSLDGEAETNRFAQSVVQLVRANPRRSRRQGKRPAATATFGIGIAAACAAIVILVVMIAVPSTPQVAENPKKSTPPAPKTVEQPKSSHDNLPASRGGSVVIAPSKIVPPPVTRALTDNYVPNPPEEPEVVPAPPENHVADAVPNTAPTQHEVPALGSVRRIQHAAAIVQRMDQSGAEANARVNDRCMEGDLLRVIPTMGSSEPSGVEVALKDGSLLWLAGGASVRFHDENDAACPTLENGEVTAHVATQSPGHPFRIRTRIGPAVEVVGTVFRLSADAAKKHVSLRVDEGKVLFSSQNVERKVSAGESSDSEDGRAPSVPVNFRPKPAVLAGVVIEKLGGKPLSGAIVRVIPVARRKGDLKWPTMKTDAQGRFKFEALREGNVLVGVESESNGMIGHFGIARARLAPGEETDVNIAVEKAMLVVGKVAEDAHSLPSKDYRVRFIGDNGDGLTLSPTLNLNNVEDGYASVAIQGAGRYVPLVEKPGALIKVRSPRNVGLVPDRPNQCLIDVQVSTSAALKGRILDNATSSVIVDEPGMDTADPRLPHTTLMLTLPNGWLQSVAAEADGTYSFNTNLDTGNYELKVQRFGYAPFTKRLTLTAGQVTDLDVGLDAHR